MQKDHSITALCAAFQVSKSGYYQWRKTQSNPSPRQKENQSLKEDIIRIHGNSRKTYGAPRIRIELRKEGKRHGKNRVANLMREQHICGRAKKRFRVKTTDSNHDQPIAPNHLASMDKPTGPDQIWVADITYIWTMEGWLYLAVIMDLYSRRIVGWSMSSSINTALVLGAWNMALTHRNPPAGLLFHSDRGVQYASLQYRTALELSRAIASMSRKGNCYDNAVMEAFWSTLKLELIYREEFQTHAQAQSKIFDYIEVFYNRKRLHSSLGYQTPVEFENARN